MPRNAEDVENFLYELNRTFERDGDSFVVSMGSDSPPIAVLVADPVVVVRASIGSVPAELPRQNAVFRQLLQYNCTDLVHATYALEEGDRIVLTAGLALENLDKNELGAALSDVEMALDRHISILSGLAKGESQPPPASNTAPAAGSAD